ncbi:ABC transporter ATP-binding protein [Sorangium cellulosum]|uniref:ABC transporter ATP-binding protein n=2 Tax=Sorangium cellulosum TaxID=56 RepID=A0A150TQB4_SORCE|nr:ABC transporter ATP-binding protein [Sorangium cellulosum]AGP34490.1 hypothetical protein SCE1572_08210 [Sorangium cellulosum So0157-2]KYF62732.1 ABC transporter ATP-binding protein [Sorangium cellulosum]KYG06893.1 ABC transporter ATP-binding protein [Sorangium cellulosum]
MADPRERTQGDAPPVIEAAGLSCRYGDHLALDRLDLTVNAGEIVCLLGANGAGKTTTIQLFLGFLRPSAGAARIGGVDVAARPDESRRRSAYIPEQVALYDELSGLENLEYFTALGGRGPRPRAELARILVEIGLQEDALHRRAATYSKGMRQKVGIAIARARGAEALFLDEPTSGLDPAAANDLSALLREVQRGGAAILMATHDVFRAKELAARVGIMRRGRLLAVLRTEEIDAAGLERIYLEHMSR